MVKMKSQTGFKYFFILSGALITLISCNSNAVDSMASDAALSDRISRYVTCPADTVSLMLAASDSICEIVKEYSLEELGLDDETVNTVHKVRYNNEIKTIVKLYGTYDVVTNFPTSEANAAFAWHEVANSLITAHYGKDEIEDEDVGKLFKVICDILESYYSGTQYDLNVSARRGVMLSDYLLINSYKTLYDSCKSPALLKPIQDSYINLLEMFRNRCEQIDGRWSDLPRQIACMQSSMMDERCGLIREINDRYNQGVLTISSVMAELDRLEVDVDWDISNY